MEGIDIKVARLRAGMKQYELAAELGICQTKLSEIECGRRELSGELLEQIMRVLTTPRAPHRTQIIRPT